jgi:pyridoxine 5-phosphate synthase
MVRLHVNVDHVATVRNARGTTYPDPVDAALLCLKAGAHGITAHLREDRRHIRDDDVARLRKEVPLFNLEMAATDEMVEIATRIRPDIVTLVPERRQERTTEGGLDVVSNGEALERAIRRIKHCGARVSLFIAADPAQIRASKDVGADQIELHTGDYAHDPTNAGEFRRLGEGARFAHELALEVAAGHGLTTVNVRPLMAIPEIVELNIGHALIADSIFLGLEGAVRAMLSAMGTGVAAAP